MGAVTARRSGILFTDTFQKKGNNMSLYRIALNPNRCIGCKSCLVHCNIKNQLPPGVSLNTIKTLGPFIGSEGRPRIEFVYQNCMQCDDPFCVKACPAGALTKRPEDGLVWLDEDACIGCKRCIDACPWSVPVYVEGLDKVKKCDYCKDRVDQGLDPACVTGCTAKALTFIRPQR